MKPLNLLTISALALAGMTLAASGTDALLTPRAKDNQPKTVRASTADPNLISAASRTTVVPRSLDNQAKAAPQRETRNLAQGACAMGSPKQIDRMGKAPSTACCAVSAAPCNAQKACCAKD